MQMRRTDIDCASSLPQQPSKAFKMALLEDCLFEIDGQGPAPTKDYYQFTVTKTEVIWRSWKISLRSAFRNARPGELRMPHKDFLEDSRLQGQVRVVYGQKTVSYTLALCRGEFDFLERIPDALLLCILSHLELEDIARLRLTSRRLRQVCDSEEFWAQAVWSRCGPPSPQVSSLARELGWRQVFFTSKLQLQKLLSRRRRGNPRSPTHPHAAHTVSLTLSDMGLGSGPYSGPSPYSGAGPSPGPSPGSGPSTSPGPSPDSGTGPSPWPSPDSGTGPSPGPSPDSGAGPGSSPGPSPDSGTGPSPDSGTGPSPDSGTGSSPGPSPDSGAGPSPGPSPDSGTGPSPDSGTGPSPDSGTGPSPDSGTGPSPWPSPDSGTGPSPGPSPDSGAGPGSSPGPSPDSGTGPSPDSGTGPSPDSGTGSSPDPSLDSGAGPSPTPNLKTRAWLYVEDQGGQVGEADHSPSPNPSHNPSPNSRPSPGPGLPGEQLAGLRKEPEVQRDPGNGRGDWKPDSGRLK